MALFPAHAGVILSNFSEVKAAIAFPRTRGGDPDIALLEALAANFSPHTRG